MVCCRAPRFWLSVGRFVHALSSEQPVTYRTCVLACRLFKVVLALEVINDVLAISQLVVKSADEDTLGMVQWDLGVLLNCLCLTLKALESYAQTPLGQIHTPRAVLQRKVLLLEQDILGKSIKLALRDIVHRFGEHLDGMGLENETAEVCQRTWDSEMV
jgi:Nucleoporin protein Ndc1-Nup